MSEPEAREVVIAMIERHRLNPDQCSPECICFEIAEELKWKPSPQKN